MEKHRTYQIDRRYFHFVGKPCWAHWAHSSSHSGSSWRDSRERACILTGTAELTVRPVDQVELTCNSSNYTNLSFMGEPTVNLLEGTVCCSINYTRTETRWYKTEEDANAGRNGSYNHDDYVIAREKAYKDSTSVTFDIREWNTGKVVWKR